MRPSISISEWDFITRFRPEHHPDGSYYVQRDWTDPVDRPLIDRADAERRLWTHVDDGAGNGGVVQGFARVNREFYIICEQPYDEDETIYVISEIDFCTICGERFADTIDADPDDEDVVPRAPTDSSLCVACFRT